MPHGVGHGLGGIAALDAKETETEAPDMLEATRRLTLAWLHGALGADDGAWPCACLALKCEAAPLADVTQRKRLTLAMMQAGRKKFGGAPGSLKDWLSAPMSDQA